MTVQRAPTTALLPAGTWSIDRDHSHIEFVARHLLSRVRGRFRRFAGVMDVDPDPSRSSVEATIEAKSIDTDHGERDAHLRSGDFLDVDRFPAVSFSSTSVDALGADGRFQVEGDLTIRDVTRRIVLDCRYLGWSDDPWGGKRAAFSARAELDRYDFGATWNVVLESGGLLVGRKVQIELEIEALLITD